MKGTIFMLATILVVFVTLFAVLLVHPPRTVKAGRGCSDASLKGNYGLVGTGTWYEGYNVSFSMLATFDGKGDVTGSRLIVFSAYYGSYGPYSFTTGTYTVNSDCTCNLTIPVEDAGLPYGLTLNGIVVGTGGDEVTGAWNAAGEMSSGTFDAKTVAEGKQNFF